MAFPLGIKLYPHGAILLSFVHQWVQCAVFLLCLCVCVCVCESCLTEALWTVACQAPLSMESPRQEY